MQKSRSTVGLQLALAMMFPAKGKAGADNNGKPSKEETPDNHESLTAPPHLTGAWDFSRLFQVEAEPDCVKSAKESAKKIQDLTHDAWRMTVRAASKSSSTAKPTTVAKITGESFVSKPMTHEEIRLLLQSFNAGPYACLKYQGDVPYEETRNYVPRVMKYYEEDLSSDYDKYINESAARYGLDPQMVRAIVKTESDFRNDCVSHAGARGLMQVMPVVWKDIQDKYDSNWEYSTGVFDPQKNIDVACAYLAWLRYDFLPRHFETFDRNPDAPICLVRDRDRGVPDRESPRIIAKSDTTTRDASVEVASADDAEKKIKAEKDAAKGDSKSASDSDSKSDNSDKASDDSDKKSAKKPKVEISDADKEKIVKKTTRNGKTRVVMRGGSGKSVAISVDGSGKVKAQGVADKDRDELEKQRHPSVAKAASKDNEEHGS